MGLKISEIIAATKKPRSSTLYSFVMLQLFIPGGIGSLALYFLEQAGETTNPNNNKFLYIGIGLLALALTSSIVGHVLGYRTKTQELFITQNKNDDDQSIVLLKIAYEEIERSRINWRETLKEQREDFMKNMTEARTHYEIKEQDLRDVYHTKLDKAQAVYMRTTLECAQIKTSLKNAGIQLTENMDLIMPEGFNRRGNNKPTT